MSTVIDTAITKTKAAILASFGELKGTAYSRKIQARWTTDVMNDAKAMNIDLETEIAGALVSEMGTEITLDLLTKMRAIAPTKTIDMTDFYDHGFVGGYKAPVLALKALVEQTSPESILIVSPTWLTMIQAASTIYAGEDGNSIPAVTEELFERDYKDANKHEGTMIRLGYFIGRAVFIDVYASDTIMPSILEPGWFEYKTEDVIQLTEIREEEYHYPEVVDGQVTTNPTKERVQMFGTDVMVSVDPTKVINIQRSVRC
jgi:hypothetical protein